MIEAAPVCPTCGEPHDFHELCQTGADPRRDYARWLYERAADARRSALECSIEATRCATKADRIMEDLRRATAQQS